MINRTTLFASIALLGFVLITSSCKKCKLASGNNYTGLAVEDVVIYPKSGYLTDNMGGNFHIHGGSSYAAQFEISFDGGQTRGPVNYSQYSILANPMSVDCEAALNKDVTYNPTFDAYEYTISGETCSNCEPKRYLENYVLVPAIPAGATIIYDQNVTAK